MTLTTVNISGCELMNGEVHELLSLVAGTIKALAWMSSLESNAGLPQVILPKLRSLTLHDKAAGFFNYTGIDSTVFAPSLRTFEYYEGPEDPKEETRSIMVKFLRNSPKLEVLKIRNSLARKVLTESALAPFVFQLTEVTFEMNEADLMDNIIQGQMLQFITPDLPTFLLSQHSSLTHLRLENAVLRYSDFTAIFMLQIKHLEIGSCHMDMQSFDPMFLFSENRSIEKFIFRRPHHAEGFQAIGQKAVLDNVLLNCRDLRSIEFNNGHLALAWMSNLSRRDSLTDLKLVCCRDLWSLHIASLRTLTIVKNGNVPEREVDEVSQLILLNPQLEKINVPVSFKNNPAFVCIVNGFDVEYNQTHSSRFNWN